MAEPGGAFYRHIEESTFLPLIHRSASKVRQKNPPAVRLSRQALPRPLVFLGPWLALVLASKSDLK